MVDSLSYENIHKKTWHRHGEDREDKSMFDLFLVRRNMVGSVHAVRSRRGLGGGGVMRSYGMIGLVVLYCIWYRTRNMSVEYEDDSGGNEE